MILKEIDIFHVSPVIRGPKYPRYYTSEQRVTVVGLIIKDADNKIYLKLGVSVRHRREKPNNIYARDLAFVRADTAPMGVIDLTGIENIYELSHKACEIVKMTAEIVVRSGYARHVIQESTGSDVIPFITFQKNAGNILTGINKTPVIEDLLERSRLFKQLPVKLKSSQAA